MDARLIIISLLIFIAIAVIIVMYVFAQDILKKMSKYQDKKSIIRFYKIEFVGYGLLILSLVWILMVNSMSSLKSGADNLTINKKLYAIYYKLDQNEERSYDYGKLQENKTDIKGWKEYYDYKTEWRRLWSESDIQQEYLDTQSNITSIISVILVILSTVLIAIGRLADVIVNLKNIP